MMETVKISGTKLTNEEREVYIYLDPIERVWILDPLPLKGKAVKSF